LNTLAGSEDKRIETLDSFRCLAILAVMFFHYYSRWTQPLYYTNFYPFGNKFVNLFKYGYIGVPFFFTISGFVIFYTLEKSGSFRSFFLRRISRLFPPILICSVLTFFIVMWLDPTIHYPIFHQPTAHGFFPSLTFSNPLIWDFIFKRNDIAFVDGAYWSLRVEVFFYIAAGAFYFLNKKNFFACWLKFATTLFLLRFIASILAGYSSVPFFRHTDAFFDNYLMLSNYIMYFTVGMVFYLLFFKREIPRVYLMLVGVLSILQMVHYIEGPGLIPIIIIFLIFIYKPNYLNFLNAKLITRIGLISYTMYLLHQFIGVILINKLYDAIDIPVLGPAIPILIMAFIALVSELIYRVFEHPVNVFLKNRIRKYFE
jgi:peptidoglycan/LPS O-acetylase OafA/YrhL